MDQFVPLPMNPEDVIAVLAEIGELERLETALDTRSQHGLAIWTQPDTGLRVDQFREPVIIGGGEMLEMDAHRAPSVRRC